jgi:hypothetical protein
LIVSSKGLVDEVGHERSACVGLVELDPQDFVQVDVGGALFAVGGAVVARTDKRRAEQLEGAQGAVCHATLDHARDRRHAVVEVSSGGVIVARGDLERG